MIQWELSLRCDDAKYSTKAIFSSSWKIWQTLKFLALGKFSNFLPVSSFRNCQNFPTQEVSTLSKLRTSMLSWLRTTAATEWFAGYLFNTQSQLICIIIAQPNIQLRLCMFQRNRRWQGWMVGRKTTDEVGCWNTLMNSMNELISVTFARKKTFVSWRESSTTYPVHSKSDCVIVS